MSSTREAPGTVSQKLYASTSGNHRESSPTLFATGYRASWTGETQLDENQPRLAAEDRHRHTMGVTGHRTEKVRVRFSGAALGEQLLPIIKRHPTTITAFGNFNPCFCLHHTQAGIHSIARNLASSCFSSYSCSIQRWPGKIRRRLAYILCVQIPCFWKVFTQK